MVSGSGGARLYPAVAAAPGTRAGSVFGAYRRAGSCVSGDGRRRRVCRVPLGRCRSLRLLCLLWSVGAEWPAMRCSEGYRRVLPAPQPDSSLLIVPLKDVAIPLVRACGRGAFLADRAAAPLFPSSDIYTRLSCARAALEVFMDVIRRGCQAVLIYHR